MRRNSNALSKLSGLHCDNAIALMLLLRLLKNFHVGSKGFYLDVKMSSNFPQRYQILLSLFLPTRYCGVLNIILLELT